MKGYDDRRFTRWVEFPNRGHSHTRVYVVSIGLCALGTIEELAGNNQHAPAECLYPKPEDAAKAKQALRDWWAKLPSKKQE